MRHYPINSPHAAARVVALTLLADGTLGRGELNTLFQFRIYERLGLDSSEAQTLLENLARDLYEFGAPAWDHVGGLHPLVIRCVLDDVTDPELRQDVLQMCRAVAESDGHLSNGEATVLEHARTHWHLPPSTLHMEKEAA